MSHSGKTIVAGIIGWPVAHSRSPLLHGHWLEEKKIDGAYIPLPVSSENFKDALRALPKLGFAGVNVTIPHKQAAFEAVDKTDEIATQTGAVNTVTIQNDGQLLGTNTDVFGFLQNLDAGAPQWRSLGGPVAVLGAGGAVRAVCAALQSVALDNIRLVNRTREKAENISQIFGGNIDVVSWDERHDALADCALLVNGTSLGMSGQQPLDLKLDALPVDAVVTDIVYSPLKTPLLKNAEDRGNPIVDGLGMLIHQARPGFAAWFGALPEASEEIRNLLIRDLEL